MGYSETLNKKALNKLRHSPFCRAILYLKNKPGHIWIYAWPQAYNNGWSVSEWADTLYPICMVLTGHSWEEDRFELMRQESVVELVLRYRTITEEWEPSW